MPTPIGLLLVALSAFLIARYVVADLVRDRRAPGAPPRPDAAPSDRTVLEPDVWTALADLQYERAVDDLST